MTALSKTFASARPATAAPTIISVGEDRRSSASQRVHEALRERIVSLDLAPGEHVSRTDIAARYGVSQTPVRDAMMKLEEEGLIVVRPQSKTEVSRIDVDHARKTQFLRLSVELEVTRRLSLSADPAAAVLQARRILAQQRTALETGDMELFRALDSYFHYALCEAAGVGDLWRMIAARSGHIDRLRALNLPDPGKPASILDHHLSIVDAVAAGDMAGAEEAVREHLSGTLAAVDQIVADHPDYF